MNKSFVMWTVFVTIVFLLIFFDLIFFQKKSIRDNIKASIAYISIGFLFGFWILYQTNVQCFYEYLTVFLVEKTLSLDNMMVISFIFSGLSIPPKNQHKVLFWGILGAIVLRGIMIALGVQIIESFSWVLYVFSVCLIFIGIKIFFESNQINHIENIKMFKFLSKHLNVRKNLDDSKFFMVHNVSKKLCITPLFLALILVELCDAIFAIDSIPAAFSITKDPYIIYTSNMFAIIGLRSLYIFISEMMNRFHYIKFFLATILIFIGSKIFIADILDIEKIPAFISLFITLSILIVGFLYSLKNTKIRV